MNQAILSMLDLLAQPVDQFVKYKYNANTKTVYPKDLNNDMQDSDGKESACNAGDLGSRFDLWVQKIPRRRKWQPTPVFFLGEFPWTEEPGRL